MKKDIKDKKNVTMEAKLMDALCKLLKTDNLMNIKTLQLLETAKVPKSSFYRLYDGIDDLVQSIEDQILDDLRDIAKYLIGSDIRTERDEETNECVNRIFRYISDHRGIYLALLSANGDLRFVYRHNRLIREFYGGKVAFEGFVNEYPEFNMRFALGGHNEIMKYWLEERDDISPEEMGAIVQSLMYGIYYNADRKE